MKNVRLITLGLCTFFLALIVSPLLHAQEETPKDTMKPAILTDTLGAALLNEFSKDFDEVFKSVRTALEGSGYIVNYTSKKRKLIETEFRQLANPDNFYDEMEKYGDVPYLRSPGWTIGRVRVSVTFEQVDSARTGVKVLAQLSGYEERFTNMWHYWRSNGKIEEEVMNAIVATVEGKEEAKTE